MTDLTVRPAYLLCYAADQMGCGFHRINLPLASLISAGITDGRVDMQYWPEDVLAAAKPDVIVWQRPIEDAQVEGMKKARAALPDALFIYELDDYLGELPKRSFHAGFMPPNLAGRVKTAMELCDRVTVSTEPLREWFLEMGAKDVRVVPNAIPANRIVQRVPTEGRIRVGFAGGISHAGDLDLIVEAMREIGDRVQWVFMGTKPENCPVDVEFHEGVSPSAYMEAMAALNVDLMLAPLEDNRFNQCKSNLRILEAAMCGASVIAQDLTPYHAGKPPVFAYAKRPGDWTKEILRFAELPAAVRQKFADELQDWLRKHHTLERLLQDRKAAWLPDAATWKPKEARKPAMEKLIVAMHGADMLPHFIRHAAREETLEAACRKAVATGADVLWMRAGTTLPEISWYATQSAMAQADHFASAAPLGSDGPNAFPRQENWTPFSPQATERTAQAFHAELRDFGLPMPAVTGPVVLLNRNALAMGGIPDVEGCQGQEDAALVEWGFRMTMRGWQHVQECGCFVSSMVPPGAVPPGVSTRLQARGYPQQARIPMGKLPDESRQNVELRVLRDQWTGLRPGVGGLGQDYASWAALREVARKPEEKEAGAEFAVVKFGDEIPTGTSWVLWLDEATTLKPYALAAFAAKVEAAGPLVEAVIYADHEMTFEGQMFPDFKPDFDPTLLEARDYVTQPCLVPADWGVMQDKVDLYERILHYARGFGEVMHIPEVLATVAGEKTAEQQPIDVVRRQMIVQAIHPDATVTAHRQAMGCLSVVHKPRVDEETGLFPSVLIVIPTLGNGRLIQPCVNTIRQLTRYPNYRVLVVLNGAQEEPDLGPEALGDERVSWVKWEGGWDWSAINNWAINDFARPDDLIVTMNDDCCVSSEHWLDAMVGRRQQGGGIVGARLVHPMGVVQHAGVVVHNGVAGHVHKGAPNGHAGFHGAAVLTHEVSAVTGACMLFSRGLFLDIGGFPDDFPINYSDTDFCLRASRTLDYPAPIIVEMAAELIHAEGTTRSAEGFKLQELLEDNVRFAEAWPGPDHYWNPNLVLAPDARGGVAGLNFERLAWQEPEPPGPEAERVLLINDTPGIQSRALEVTKAGSIVMLADLSGLHFRLTAPNPPNVPIWDIRHTKGIVDALRRLGVGRVEVCSETGLTGALMEEPTTALLNTLRDSGIVTAAKWGVFASQRPTEDGGATGYLVPKPVSAEAAE